MYRVKNKKKIKIYNWFLSKSLRNKAPLVDPNTAFEGGLLIFSSNRLNTNFTGIHATVVGPRPEDSGSFKTPSSIGPPPVVALLKKLCSMAMEDRVLVFWLDDDKLTFFGAFFLFAAKLPDFLAALFSRSKNGNS